MDVWGGLVVEMQGGEVGPLWCDVLFIFEIFETSLCCLKSNGKFAVRATTVRTVRMH